MKNIIRVIALSLVLLTILPLLFACQKTPGDVGGTGTEVDSEEFKSVPDMNLGGRDFNILISPTSLSQVNATAKSDFDENVDQSTVLGKAVADRIAVVEELYNLNISFFAESTYKAGVPGPGYQNVMNCINSGTRDYDLAYIAGYDMTATISNNGLYNLFDVPNLDVTASWWDGKVIRDLVYNNKLYFSNGDISYYDDVMQNTVIFNKTSYAENIADINVYDLVRDGTWTLDVLADMSKYNVEDTNGDGRWDMTDSYGIMTWNDSAYAIASSTGEKVVSYDESSNSLKLTLVNNEKINNALTKYTEFTTGSLGYGINRNRFNVENGTTAMFSEGRSIFIVGTLDTIPAFADMEVDFGILPYPKASADVADYNTVVSPYHATYFGIINLEDGLAEAGAVTNALAYYGQQILTPAYYDKVLTGRLIRDDESIISLETMAQNRVYDWGYIIEPGDINKQIASLYVASSLNFASAFEAKRAAAEAELAEVNAYFTALE